MKKMTEAELDVWIAKAIGCKVEFCPDHTCPGVITIHGSDTTMHMSGNHSFVNSLDFCMQILLPFLAKKNWFLSTITKNHILFAGSPDPGYTVSFFGGSFLTIRMNGATAATAFCKTFYTIMKMDEHIEGISLPNEDRGVEFEQSQL